MLLLQGDIFVRLIVFVTAIFSIVQIGLFILKNILHELQFIIFILMIVINIDALKDNIMLSTENDFTEMNGS